MDDLDLGATIKGFAPGQKVFNRYTLKKILGRGGMGVVWLARDEELEREVALKFLPEIVALDPEAMADLKRETRRNLDLTHPHIVRIYDFVSDNRTAAISMEYVDGATLSALKLERPGRVFTIAELTVWLEQLCTALTYAHTKAKIVHRDLKPANLMITRNGDLKITDFGIARGISDSVSRVSAQLAGSSGTPVYMSPQQMMGERAAVTDDIYAIGATLYELLTGKPPFHSGNIIMQVQAKVPPSLAERRAELGVTGEVIPAPWERTIASCLAKEAAERPPSTLELLGRLKGDAAKPAAPAVTPAAPPPIAPRVAAPPPLPTASPADAATKISGVRRWLLAPLLAGLLPAVACAAFMMGWRALGYAYGEELLQVGLVIFLVMVPVMALAAMALLGLWRLCGGKTQPLLIGIGAGCGGLFAAGVVLYLANDRVAAFTLERVGWTLFFGEVAMAFGGGIVVGACSAYLLRWLAYGAAVGRGLISFGMAAAGLFTGAFLFGYILPPRFEATYSGENDRQYRIWEAMDRERREAEEARAKAEAAALAQKRAQDEAAQRALREQQAVGLIREAYRMVFDRAPDAQTVARYTALMIQNPNWDAARLRKELRSSPEGLKGGRLLVPEEFSTIRAAVDAAVAGNVVHVAPGIYRESVYINKAVSLIGAGRDRVTIEVAPNQNALNVSKVSGITVSGFTFRHNATADTETRSFVVSITEGSLVFEDNAVLDGNGDGLNLKDGGFATVRRNIIRNHRWTGLSLFANASGRIEDNLIERNQTGIHIRAVLGRTEIIGNDLRGNQRNGIWVGEGDNVTLNNNRVTGNGTVGERYGGIGIGKGRPTLNGNVAFDNIGTGIWWNAAAQPNIGRGNMSDGKDLTAP
ncbi:MAG: protein kinase [Opitutaceae bacterium]|nr:protein kinase [Opitutaceae bacterium]